MTSYYCFLNVPVVFLLSNKQISGFYIFDVVKIVCGFKISEVVVLPRLVQIYVQMDFESKI